jgi:hypothetical protein
MATINYQLVGVCTGGGHAAVDVTLNGGATRRVVYTSDEIRAPLNQLTADEREALALLILKVHFAGMTRVQMRNALEAPGGVTVTV